MSDLENKSDFTDSYEPSTTVDDHGQPRRVPGGLTAVCVIGMVLGGIGLIAGMASGVGVLTGGQAQTALNQPNEGLSPEMQDLQQTLEQEMRKVAQQFVVPNTAAVLFHLVTAVLLLVGAIMTLQRKERGPGIFTIACATSIMYLVGQRILDVLFQQQAWPVYQKFGDALMAEAARGQGADLPEMPNVFLIMIIIFLVVMILISLATIAFYIFAILYLRRPAIRELCRPRSSHVPSF